MYAIIKDLKQVYTFNEKPKFQRGVLAYPLKAFDILENEVAIIEFEDTVKPESTSQLKEVFRDGIIDGKQVWNERNIFDTAEQEAEYLAKLQADEFVSLKSAIELAVDSHLDTKAKSLGYTGINSIAKYIGYNNTFRLEAESIGAWVASCWDKVIEIQARQDLTTTVDSVITELPEYIGV